MGIQEMEGDSHESCLDKFCNMARCLTNHGSLTLHSSSALRNAQDNGHELEIVNGSSCFQKRKKEVKQNSLSQLIVSVPITPNPDDINAGIENAGMLPKEDLLRLLNEFQQSEEIKLLAAKNGLDAHLFHQAFLSFRRFCIDGNAMPTELHIVISDILAEADHVHSLFPYYYEHARKVFPHLDSVEDLQKISDLTIPASWSNFTSTENLRGNISQPNLRIILDALERKFETVCRRVEAGFAKFVYSDSPPQWLLKYIEANKLCPTFENQMPHSSHCFSPDKEAEACQQQSFKFEPPEQQAIDMLLQRALIELEVTKGELMKLQSQSSRHTEEISKLKEKYHDLQQVLEHKETISMEFSPQSTLLKNEGALDQAVEVENSLKGDLQKIQDQLSITVKDKDFILSKTVVSETNSEGERDLKINPTEDQIKQREEKEEINDIDRVGLLSTSVATCALGEWEKHTKGIGSKIMVKLGYVMGLGLGKRGEGRTEPVEAIVLPRGKSLDRCMEIKEKAKGKSVLRRNKRLKRKNMVVEEQEKKFIEEQAGRENHFLFSFDLLKTKTSSGIQEDRTLHDGMDRDDAYIEAKYNMDDYDSEEGNVNLFARGAKSITSNKKMPQEATPGSKPKPNKRQVKEEEEDGSENMDEEEDEGASNLGSDEEGESEEGEGEVEEAEDEIEEEEGSGEDEEESGENEEENGEDEVTKNTPIQDEGETKVNGAAQEKFKKEFKGKCIKCKQVGHKISACSENLNRNKCFSCGKEGHKSKECSTGKGHKFITCFVCSENGHFARECPENTKKKRQTHTPCVDFITEPPSN